jgi:hypothetical protein
MRTDRVVAAKASPAPPTPASAEWLREFREASPERRDEMLEEDKRRRFGLTVAQKTGFRRQYHGSSVPTATVIDGNAWAKLSPRQRARPLREIRAMLERPIIHLRRDHERAPRPRRRSSRCRARSPGRESSSDPDEADSPDVARASGRFSVPGGRP